MRFLINLFKKYTAIGIEKNNRDILANSTVILTNRFTLLAQGVLLLNGANFYFLGLENLALMHLIYFLALFLVPVLNHFNYRNLASFGLILVGNLAILHPALLLGVESGEYFGFFIMPFIIFIVFRKSEDRYWAMAGNIITLLFLLTCFFQADPQVFLQDETLLSSWNIFVAFFVVVLASVTYKVFSNSEFQKLVETAKTETHKLIKNAPDAIFVLDPNSFEILEYNTKAEEFFGFDVVARTKYIFDLPFMPFDALPAPKVRRFLKYNNLFTDEFEFRGKNKNFWGNLVINKIVTGNQENFLARIKDITSNKQTEFVLHSMGAEMEQMQQIMKVGYTYISSDLQLVNKISRQAMNHFNVTGDFRRTQLENVLAHVQAEDKVKFLQELKSHYDSKQPFDIVVKTINEQNRTKWISIRVDFNFDFQKNILNIVLITLDITDLKKVESTLNTGLSHLQNHQKHLNRITELTGRDLKKPIEDILEVLRIVRPNPAQFVSYISLIEQYCIHLDETIKTFLDYFKILNAEFKPEILDLEQLAQNLLKELDILIAANQVDVKFEGLEGCIINSDPELIKILLRSLLSNAIKYHNDNINYKFSCLKTNKTEQFLEIEVIDNGRGLSAETQQLLREAIDNKKLFNLEAGLGLHTITLICEKLDAELDFFTNQNGTTFKIKLKQ